jgi:hypothetical protein
MTYNYKEKVDNCGYIQKRWTDGGKLHREGGPAWIVCNYDGSVKFENIILMACCIEKMVRPKFITIPMEVFWASILSLTTNDLALKKKVFGSCGKR